MENTNDPKQEGHVKEWQDRARVVLDAKEAVKHDAYQNQSPKPDEIEDVEEKSKDIEKGRGQRSDY